FNRLSEIPSRRAASSWPIPIGLRNSSRSISPGGIDGPSQFGSLVIVFDADFVGMTLLPSERDAILIVDPNAVSARLVALQRLQTVAGRNYQILEPYGDVECLQFSLRDSPQFTRHSASGARVPFAEQVGRRLVRKRLDHIYLHATRIACN